VRKTQKTKKNQTNLAQFFLESPLRGSELDLTRDRRPADYETVREILRDERQ
jgi:hypothetical protein